MHDVLRFWLDRGVDGFRADVVHLIGKDEALPDQPDELAHLDIVGAHEHPRTHELLRDIRRVLDELPGDRVMVGEVPLRPPGPARSLLRRRRRAAHGLRLRADARAVVGRGVRERDRSRPSGRSRRPALWPCWVLSNHDQPRHRSRFGGSEARARAAAVLLLTLRGTPCLYAGEELGLLDADVPAAARVDPGGRDGSRAPIPWDGTPLHGWPPTPGCRGRREPGRRNAESESADPDSILALYRRLLAIRRSSPALELGSWRLLDSPRRHARLRAVSRTATFAGSPSTSAIARAPGVAAADGWRRRAHDRRARRPALGRIPRAGRGGHPRLAGAEPISLVDVEVLVHHPVDAEALLDRARARRLGRDPSRPLTAASGFLGRRDEEAVRRRDSTISGIDPRAVAITGVPQAIASITLKPNGSSKLIRCRSARAPPSSSLRPSARPARRR